mmetsp:Transcript_11663/g.15015  ORF Transcript_11663/g.15015 Transcript_11663/m.15015 type:complete len:624 (-) Transcript_11663:399-2270(-)
MSIINISSFHFIPLSFLGSAQKYVPPHLRNTGGGGSGSAVAPPQQQQRTTAPSGNNPPPPQARDARGGGYSAPPPPKTNNRWNDDGGGGGGGYNRYGGGDARKGGGGYGGGGGGSRNAQGFHGDTRPNSRTEQQLFGQPSQTQGINFGNYDNIPVETSGDNVPEPYLEFPPEVLGDALMNNLALCNYSKPTPVQKYSLPIGMAKRDMMACAQTGSGKTAGFLFPVLVSMLRDGAPERPQDNGNYRSRKQYPMALILSPTRELTSQIFDEAQKFTYCTGIRSVVIYGGAEVRNQLNDLERGCDLLVATPGRLVDLLERGRLSLASIKFLVLDEADRMLDMGFEPQIRRIVEQEGMSPDRQTFMFSATFPNEIQRLASDFMHEYIFLAVGRVGSASKDVTQQIYYVENKDKEDTLMDFLNTIESGLVLIFVETKRGADSLEALLCRCGYPAASIHGDKSQRERESALSMFKSGNTPVLVATDVAARGLDIPNVTQVINYDLPSNIDDYVHRIGRTGRVGNVGHALSFMNDKNRNLVRELHELLTEGKQEVPSWMANMVQYSSSGFGKGNRGKGNRNNKFGARDVRRDHGGGGGGGHHGGGGYNQGGGYGGGGYSNSGGYNDNSAW